MTRSYVPPQPAPMASRTARRVAAESGATRQVRLPQVTVPARPGVPSTSVSTVPFRPVHFPKKAAGSLGGPEAGSRVSDAVPAAPGEYPERASLPADGARTG